MSSSATSRPERRNRVATQNPGVYTLIWVVIMIEVFALLAVGRFKKAANKS